MLSWLCSVIDTHTGGLTSTAADGADGDVGIGTAAHHGKVETSSSNTGVSTPFVYPHEIRGLREQFDNPLLFSLLHAAELITETLKDRTKRRVLHKQLIPT